MGKVNQDIMGKVNQEKIDLIASEYCTNGYKKVDALLKAGYKDSYARSIGLRIYDDIRLKQAIERIQAHTKTKTAYNALQAEQELEQARKRAIDLKQVSAEIQATLGKCKLYALLTDNINNTTEQTPDPLTQEEIDKLKADAAAITRANIKISSGTG
jgi:phage terminase small subunit